MPQRKIRYLGRERQDYSVEGRLEVGQLAGKAKDRFSASVAAAVKIVQQIAITIVLIS